MTTTRIVLLCDVQTIVPCHCTRHKTRILEAHPGRTQTGGSGRVIELS